MPIRAKAISANIAGWFETLKNRIVILHQMSPLLRRDILVSSLAINLLMLAFPLVVLQVYDRIIPNASVNTLIVLSLGVVITVVLDVFLKVARSYVAGWAGANFEHNLGVNSAKHLLEANIEDVEKEAAGKHLDRLSGVDLVKDFYSSHASLVLVDLPFVALFLLVIAYIGGWIVFVPLILLAVFATVAQRLGKELRKGLEERLVWDNRRYNFIIETLAGIHTIKSFAMEKLFERRYERVMDASASISIKTSYFSTLSQNLGTMFGQLTLVIVVGIGSIQVIDGTLSIGALAACMLLSSRAVQPVLRGMMVWSRFQSVEVAENHLNELAVIGPKRKQLPAPKETLESIELEEVSFQYNAQEEFIIDGISLRLEPGKIIGIRGANGAGKTTLLRIVMGSTLPQKGIVSYNGEDIRTINTKSLRSQIAYLPQKPVLFDGTVLDNITMFRNKDFLDEALELCEELELDKVFGRFSDGYDTEIGATTQSTLPAGVAQRISVARALLEQPRVILFDEANSTLDGPGDKCIREAMKKRRANAAIILVSHRPSLQALADEHFDLADKVLWPSDSFSEKLRKEQKGKA